MDWKRYAIYWLPGGSLGQAGATWLGWDVRTGIPVAGADPCTETPRKYGFHATIKPPFRLADGVTPNDLRSAAENLARQLAPVDLGRLTVRRLGRFLALTPDVNPGGLAARVVEGLDGFRAPSRPKDLARRRATGLTLAQDALLLKWGYPYVMDEFRMHLTLTGPNPSDVVEARVAEIFPPLAGPHVLNTLSLAGEDAAGRFHLIADLPFAGHAAASDKTDRAAPTA